MPTSTPIPALDDETSAPIDDRSAFADLVRRLSRQSVDKHFDAYQDVDWDAPGMAVDPTDVRFRLWSFDPLGSTEWYRSQPPEVQARIGLARTASVMKIGWQFENLLQRGLLRCAMRLPNGAPEFRYLHHEIIEESQHSLMFQELVNRSGLPISGMPRPLLALATAFVVPLSWIDPPLFFLFVLGGEDPIDHMQRKAIRAGDPHPLALQIMRIHVTEEARHLSFARHELKRSVPRAGRLHRQWLGVAAPLLLGVMARLMVHPSPQLHRRFGVPKAVHAEAVRSDASRTLLRDSVAKVRRLCRDLGLVNPATRLLWKAVGLWDDDER